MIKFVIFLLIEIWNNNSSNLITVQIPNPSRPFKMQRIEKGLILICNNYRKKIINLDNINYLKTFLVSAVYKVFIIQMREKIHTHYNPQICLTIQ